MKVCAYFGNRYIDTYREHMKEIKDHGFDSILHPISEQDIMFDRGEVVRLIYETKDAGFTCWVDPHCVGNLFGYGSISKYDKLNALGHESRMLFRKWIDLIKSADWILWDEPDFKNEAIFDFLDIMCADTHSHGLRNSVCFWGSRADLNKDYINKLEKIQYVDDIAVSLTPLGIQDTTYMGNWLKTLKATNKLSSIWIPGYEIKIGTEQYIDKAINICKDVSTIGCWGFRGCEAASYHSDDPKEVWRIIGQSLTRP